MLYRSIEAARLLRNWDEAARKCREVRPGFRTVKHQTGTLTWRLTAVVTGWQELYWRTESNSVDPNLWNRLPLSLDSPLNPQPTTRPAFNQNFPGVGSCARLDWLRPGSPPQSINLVIKIGSA